MTGFTCRRRTKGHMASDGDMIGRGVANKWVEMKSIARHASASMPPPPTFHKSHLKVEQPELFATGTSCVIPTLATHLLIGRPRWDLRTHGLAECARAEGPCWECHPDISTVNSAGLLPRPGPLFHLRRHWSGLKWQTLRGC